MKQYNFSPLLLCNFPFILLSIFLFSCLFYIPPHSLNANHQSSLYSTLLEIKLDKKIQKNIHLADSIGKQIIKEEHKEQLYYELHRFTAYLKDIPLLKNGEYPQKQSELLLLMAKVFLQAESFPNSIYPATTRRDYIKIFFDANKTVLPFPSPPYKAPTTPIGVFKCDNGRNHEIATWEFSCIFGIEEVFTPSIPITLNGKVGELQLYKTTDLSKEQSYNEALFQYVTFRSYLKCALGVLLFALEDIHNENCSYEFTYNGAIKLGMFDLLGSFSRFKFVPHSHKGVNSLATPYNWIGWDFPQANHPITKRHLSWLKGLISSWPQRIYLFNNYLNHPLTKSLIEQKKLEAMRLRAYQLVNIISNNPSSPPSNWHNTLLPQYIEAKAKLKEFFPHYGTTYMLFRLHWYPHTVMNWMTPNKQKQFQQWLDEFLK